MLFQTSKYLVLCAALLQQCMAFCAPCQLSLRRHNLLLKLDRIRELREVVRKDIVTVIERQRLHPENSREFLRLEAQFLSLLNQEDQLVIDMENTVKSITKHKSLSKNVCSLYRTYIRDA